MDYRIPYISLLNSFYVTYYRGSVNNYSNFILSLVAILILSSLIEFTYGHMFVLLLFVIQVVIHEDESETNDCCMNLNKLSFFLGASFISLILLINSTLAIICFAIFSLGIYAYFYYIKQIRANEKDYLERVDAYQYYYTFGSIIPILITMWANYEIEPQKQYIKIFLRR